MSKKDFFIGFILGLILTGIGVFLFITLATSYSFLDGVTILNREGYLNKLVALGEVLNIPLFYYLITKEKYFTARGIIFQALITTIITLFI